MLEQDGVTLAQVTEVARMVHVKPPSAVQMLKRLAGRGLVKYLDREGVHLTAKGRRVGRRMVRNGRLMEVFLTDTLKIPLDIKLAHTVEHAMTDAFANALCGFMGHPARCPHGYEIPAGTCCPERRERPERPERPGRAI